MAQQTTHKSEVVFVDGIELRCVARFICVQLGLVLLVDEPSSFLVNGELHNVRHLFAPDFLSLHVEEVLNVLE